jgi:hypothetical protein
MLRGHQHCAVPLPQQGLQFGPVLAPRAPAIVMTSFPPFFRWVLSQRAASIVEPPLQWLRVRSAKADTRLERLLMYAESGSVFAPRSNRRLLSFEISFRSPGESLLRFFEFIVYALQRTVSLRTIASNKLRLSTYTGLCGERAYTVKCLISRISRCSSDLKSG